jgi:hypothetical protein
MMAMTTTTVRINVRMAARFAFAPPLGGESIVSCMNTFLLPIEQPVINPGSTKGGIVLE